MEDRKKIKDMKLEIHADDSVVNGNYSNFIIANHSETEFTLDFIFVPPQTVKAKVLSRIILNPAHAKRLQLMLNKQLSAYEERFGEIQVRPPAPKTGSDDSGSLIN